MKKTIVTVTVVVLWASAGVAMGQGYGMGMGTRSSIALSAGSGLGGALNLTSEQVQKMQALRESFLREKIPLGNELELKQFEMRGLWMQINPDEAKLLAKQKEINALRAQIGEKAIKNRLEMRKILTPEQQAKLINLRGRLWPSLGRSCGMGMGYGLR